MPSKIHQNTMTHRTNAQNRTNVGDKMTEVAENVSNIINILCNIH